MYYFKPNQTLFEELKNRYLYLINNKINNIIKLNIKEMNSKLKSQLAMTSQIIYCDSEDLSISTESQIEHEEIEENEHQNQNYQTNQKRIEKRIEINNSNEIHLQNENEDEDEIIITNQIERKINHEIYIESVPVIFAFAITAKRQETYPDELLPPNISISASNINWKSPLDGSHVIHIACSYGKTNFIKQLLSSGVQLDVTTNEGNTPLLSAIKAGRTKVAVMILRKMTVEQINRKNERGETALFCCVKKENETVLNYLLEKQAEIDCQTNDGITPLMMAMLKNNPKIIEILLEKSSNKLFVDKNGQNCIHYYARSNKFERKTVNLLIQLTSDHILVSQKDSFGNVPLHYAVKTGNGEIVNHLLALSSMKDVGVVYNEVDNVCRSMEGRENIVGENRVSKETRTDALGFILDENQTIQQEEIESEKRIKKWQEMIEILKQKGQHQKLLKRIYKGIPHCCRKDIWTFFLQLDQVKKEKGNEYQRIVNETYSKDDVNEMYHVFEVNDRRKEIDDQIHKDVMRTHQTNINFLLKFSEGQKILFFAMKYYSEFDKEVGYVQGMADLFGLFVLALNNSEDVFYSVYQTFFNPKYQLRESFFPEFIGVMKFKTLETLMLKTYHKEIYSKVMKSGGIDILYPHLLEYYALWYCRIFPGDIAMWLLDLIVIDGWYMSLTIASTLFYFLKEKILACDDDMMCIDIILKKPLSNIDHFDKYVFMKQIKKMKISPQQIDKWLLECK